MDSNADMSDHIDELKMYELRTETKIIGYILSYTKNYIYTKLKGDLTFQPPKNQLIKKIEG
jgi:hypothetical protein